MTLRRVESYYCDYAVETWVKFTHGVNVINFHIAGAVTMFHKGCPGPCMVTFYKKGR